LPIIDSNRICTVTKTTKYASCVLYTDVNKSKMANGRYIKNRQNGYNSTTVLPIGRKFGITTHLDLPNR